MARARILKPGFFANEELAVLPVRARLTFAGLWTLADKMGRLEDRPLRIKAALFPYESNDEVAMDKSLGSLSDAGFITRYQVDGERYLLVNKFEAHQHPHKNEPDSSLPPPPVNVASTSDIVGSQSDIVGPARAVTGNRNTEAVTGDGDGNPRSDEKPSAAAPRRDKRSLPEPFVLEVERDHPRVNVQRIAAELRDYVVQHPRKYTDYPAALHSWVRRAEEKLEDSGRQAPVQPGLQHAARHRPSLYEVTA